jgi:hypothetical protein
MKDTNATTRELLEAIFDTMTKEQINEWVLDVLGDISDAFEFLLEHEDESVIREVGQEQVPHFFFEVDDPDRGYDEWRDMRDERAAED